MLVDERLFLLAPAVQRDIAARLSAAGVTVQGLRDVIDYTRHKAESESQGDRILGKVLSDPAAVPTIVASLEGWRAEHEARVQMEELDAQKREARNQEPGRSLRQLGKLSSGETQFDAVEVQRLVRALQADGKTPQEILGLFPGMLAADFLEAEQNDG